MTGIDAMLPRIGSIALLLIALPVRADDRTVDLSPVIVKVKGCVVGVTAATIPYPGQTDADLKSGRLGSYASDESSDLWNLADPRQALNHQIGGGIVLDKDGVILTPYHLIEGATKIYVRKGSMGSYANLVAYDARSDLAVLKLIKPIGTLTPVTIHSVVLNDSDTGGPTVQPGTPVFGLFEAIPGPRMLAGPTISQGIITQLGRRVPAPTDLPQEFRNSLPFVNHATLMQTDARAALGPSGAGLFNHRGELIGITTSVAAVAGSDAASGYVIPMDRTVRQIVKVLKEGREVEYGFLGVAWRDPMMFGIAPNASNGVVVQDVSPGMPANDAGIMPNDVIVAVDGVRVTNLPDMFFHIAAGLAGNKIKISIRRFDGETKTLTVKLAKTNNPYPWLATQPGPNVHGLRVEYTSTLVQEMNRNGERTPFLSRGLLVKQWEANSPAARAFLGFDANSKWIITSVNGQTVSNPSDFYELARDQDKLKLTVVRAGDPSRRTQTVILP